MEIRLYVGLPAVRAPAKRLTEANSARAVPFEFLERLDVMACDDDAPTGMQLAAPVFRLMTFAPLRFAVIRDVLEIWASKFAACVRPLGHKGKGDAIMALATP